MVPLFTPFAVTLPASFLPTALTRLGVLGLTTTLTGTSWLTLSVLSFSKTFAM